MRRRIWLGVLGIIIALVTIRVATIKPMPSHPYLAHDGVLILAHQGSSGHAPSDTIESFDLALEHGADVLELDVHLTKDGYIVVAHDDTIDRLTNGTGYIKDMTLAELRQYDFGYGFTPDRGQTYPYRGQGVTIPTLDEIFERYPHMPINIEIKQANPPMEEQLWALLQKYDRIDDVMVASFHTDVIDRWRKVSGEATAWGSPKGYMYTFAAFHVTHLDRLYQPKSYAFQVPVEQKLGPVTIRLATKRFINTAHRLGIKVHYWTINDEATMAMLVDLGADGIITDFPDRAYKVLKEKGLR